MQFIPTPKSPDAVLLERVQRFIATGVDVEAAIRIVALDNNMLAEDVAALADEADLLRGEVRRDAP